MTRKILLECLIETWSIETIEKYIFDQRKEIFSAVSFLTEDEIKTVIARLKAEALTYFDEQVKQIVPTASFEKVKDRCIRISLSKFAFAVKPQNIFPIMDTQKNLIKNFNLQIYQS